MASPIPMCNGAGSGVRDDDGMVVFEIVASEVRVDDWGCLYPDEPRAHVEAMLSLRVVKAGREYWARWGDRTRPMAQAHCAPLGAIRL